MAANAEIAEIIQRFNAASTRFDAIVSENKTFLAARALESAFARAAADPQARIPSYLSAAILNACAK